MEKEDITELQVSLGNLIATTEQQLLLLRALARWVDKK